MLEKLLSPPASPPSSLGGKGEPGISYLAAAHSLIQDQQEIGTSRCQTQGDPRFSCVLSLHCGVAFPSKQQEKQALAACLSLLWTAPRHWGFSFSAHDYQPWAQKAFNMRKCPDNGPSEAVEDSSQDHLWIPGSKGVQVPISNHMVSYPISTYHIL